MSTAVIFVCFLKDSTKLKMLLIFRNASLLIEKFYFNFHRVFCVAFLRIPFCQTSPLTLQKFIIQSFHQKLKVAGGIHKISYDNRKTFQLRFLCLSLLMVILKVVKAKSPNHFCQNALPYPDDFLLPQTGSDSMARCSAGL